MAPELHRERQGMLKGLANCAGLVRDLRNENKRLRDEIRSILRELAQANAALEDVCCGATLQCPKCNKPRPCLCQDS